MQKSPIHLMMNRAFLMSKDEILMNIIVEDI
jgi:hypothetical protein